MLILSGSEIDGSDQEMVAEGTEHVPDGIISVQKLDKKEFDTKL